MGTKLLAAQAVLLASVAMAAAPPSAPITRTKRSGPQDAASMRQSLLELNELTGAGPMRGRLKELIDENPQDAKKLLAVAFEMAKKKEQPFNRNATYLLAMTAENAKEVKISAHFYRLNAQQSAKLGSERGVAQAYLGLIQMYQDNRKFAESEKACKEILALEGEEEGDLDGVRPSVMRSMVVAIARQGDFDRALKLADELVKGDPKNWLHLALKARVLRESEKLEEAARLYLDVIKKVEKEDRMKEAVRQDYVDDYRYLLSGVYVDLKQIDKAAAQLKLLLERDPNNPTFNNDLGYVWADNGVNLPEAEKLIRKAIEEDRKQRKASSQYNADTDHDSAAYLDSLGWVLFKLGKSKEARSHLLEAVKDAEGQHTEIYDHLAEVCLDLGEKAEAVAAWKKAVEAATSSKRDQKRKAEIEKKIKKHEQK
jgi:tetratricopeptide (TPR) repeat protein